MALSERSKLLIAGGVLLATGMLLFGLLRGEPRVTVTFDRYEGETAVLIFKNKSVLIGYDRVRPKKPRRIE